MEKYSIALSDDNLLSKWKALLSRATTTNWEVSLTPALTACSLLWLENID